MFSTSQRTAPLLAVTTLAVVAPSAGAATYEQISRATGTAGVASAQVGSTRGAVSDTGLFGIFTTVTPGSSFFGDYKSYLRDTLLNRTTPITAKGLVLAVDRNERTLLSQELTFTGSTFSLSRTTGGTPKTVVTLGGGFSNATLSGDGKTIAYSSFTTGVRYYDVATGAVTTPTEGFVGVDRYSLSDDAKVLAGWLYDEATNVESGVIVKDGVRTEVSGRAHVSANGRKAFYVADRAGGGYDLVTRNVNTGAETRAAVPASVGKPYVLWISPDGSRVALGPDTGYGYGEAPSAVVLNANGQWATFGGQYSKQFADGLSVPSSLFTISRNGRYALLRFNDQVAIVSLQGHLLAGGDPLSASAYFAGNPRPQCFGPTGYLGTSLYQPAPWVPAPRSAKLTVKVGSEVVLDNVANTLAPTLPIEGLPGPELHDPAFRAQIPTNGEDVTVEWTVVDHAGRTLKETYTEPGCQPFDPGEWEE